MSATAPIAASAPPTRRVRSVWSRLKSGDEATYLITLACAFTVIAVTALLVFELFRNSSEARHQFGWSFLGGQVWDPVALKLGALPFIYGTVVTSFLALLIGIPLGVGAAIFLAELAPPGISSALTFLIELLAAVPSVIFGLLGIFVLVPILRSAEPFIRNVLGWTPLFQGPFYGYSMFTAGVVLAIMIIPFISAVTRDVFETVPDVLKESAYGLGATTWEVIWQVVVPYARTGMIGGIMLGLGRALGETMAVTFVIGNAHRIGSSLLAPGTTISASIANEFAEAVGDLYTSSLVALGALLFLITFSVIAAAQAMLRRLERRALSSV